MASVSETCMCQTNKSGLSAQYSGEADNMLCQMPRCLAHGQILYKATISVTCAPCASPSANKYHVRQLPLQARPGFNCRLSVGDHQMASARHLASYSRYMTLRPAEYNHAGATGMVRECSYAVFVVVSRLCIDELGARQAYISSSRPQHASASRRHHKQNDITSQQCIQTPLPLPW